MFIAVKRDYSFLERWVLGSYTVGEVAQYLTDTCDEILLPFAVPENWSDTKLADYIWRKSYKDLQHNINQKLSFGERYGSGNKSPSRLGTMRVFVQ